MASPTTIEHIEGKVIVELGGTVSRGQLIAYDGTSAFVAADASDAATNLYAQYIALDTGVDGQFISACKGCTFYDADAPYTANSTYYLSATAGAITSTRPTTAADVIQVVGTGISTYRARIDIRTPHEVEVLVPLSAYDTTAEAGLGVVDSPAWVGAALDTGGEDAYFTSRFPSNVLSVSAARVLYNSIGESTVTVSAALIACADGATNTGDTGTAHAAAAPTSVADNKLCYSDVTAMFDADALKAGYNFTVAVTAATKGAADLQVLGLYMRYLVV